MTKTEIKNIIQTAKTEEELEPLREYYTSLNKKAATLHQILHAKEMEINAILQLDKISKLPI